MSHDHHHHHPPDGNERRVLLALLLTGVFTLVEVAGGILTGSLALLADAGHMLTDSAALGLSWYAFRVSRRPATPAHSYGQARFQVLAAFVNGATILGIAAWIAIEAVQRLWAPVPILGGTMLLVAVTGLVVNGLAFLVLHGGDRANLNIKGAVLHVLGDLLGSVAAILAAGIILLTGWMPIDPILSVLVAGLLVRSAWTLLRHSARVLMEGTPEGLDVGRVREVIVERVEGVVDVHHVHAWSLTPERPLMTLHANLAQGADHDRALRETQEVLARHFAVHHATIQLEREHCTDGASRSGGTHHHHPRAAPRRHP
jgi:cobalt-zinc-cadmium efflux system protein